MRSVSRPILTAAETTMDPITCCDVGWLSHVHDGATANVHDDESFARLARITAIVNRSSWLSRSPKARYEKADAEAFPEAVTGLLLAVTVVRASSRHRRAANQSGPQSASSDDDGAAKLAGVEVASKANDFRSGEIPAQSPNAEQAQPLHPRSS
jgi:hypothetical protein